MAVLTLNAGSSSLKFAVFDGKRALLRGAFAAIDDAPKATASGADGAALDPPQAEGTGHEAVLPALFDWVERHRDGGRLDAVGHRIVHGGERTGPALVDDAVLAELDALSPLAPLHQPHNIAGIRAAQRAQPGLRQVACFDTAFHQTLPAVARQLALPARLGLRRYGFHGLSYEWIAGRLAPDLAAGRVVVAHLGSGASLCALQAGRSVETTMSTTPLDGLVMATRCGSLDPGVVLHLVRTLGVDAAEHLLYHEAGLLGVSGTSGDLRELGGAGPAVESVRLPGRHATWRGWPPRSAGWTGWCSPAASASTTPRCGLRSAPGWAGSASTSTRRHRPPVASATPAARVEVWVIPTDEEAVIARQAAALG